MQPIFVDEPITVEVRGEDLYITYPDDAGTFVIPIGCSFRLAIRMLDAVADHFVRDAGHTIGTA